MLNLLPLAGPILERLAALIPDPNERARAIASAEAEMRAALQASDQAQTEINRTEAASGSLFIGGWRPFIGWTCGVALAWAFVAGPMLKWWMVLNGVPHENLPPSLMTADLWELVFAMLGLGAFRTYEKMKGVAAPGIGGR